MGHKHISEETLKTMRKKEKNKYADTVSPSEVSDVCSWNSRYKHCYFEDFTVTHDDYKDPMLVFTVRVNYLPAKPVYIDIDNIRELLLSLATKYSHIQVKELKDELLDLLAHYRKIS